MQKRIPFVLILLILLWPISTLFWPFHDHSFYAIIGDTILHGGIPYRHGWDVKGPATFIQFAFAQLLLGPQMWSIRVVDAFLLALALWGTAAVASGIAGSVAGLWGAVFFGLFYAREGFMGTAQPDGWAIMLLAVAAALLARGDRRWLIRVLFAGIISGWVFLYKPLYAIFIPINLLWLYVDDDRSIILTTINYISACCICPLIVIGWIYVKGGLWDMLEIQLLYNLLFHVDASHTPIQGSIVGILLALTKWGAVLAFSIAGLLWTFHNRRRKGYALLLYGIAAIIVIMAQRIIAGGHCQILLFPMAASAGVGFNYLIYIKDEEKDNLKKRTLGIFLTTLLIISLYVPVLSISRDIWGIAKPMMGLSTWKSYYNNPDRFPAYYMAFKEAAEYIRNHTKPDELIYVWSVDPMINYLSGRKSPTRFLSNIPLYVTKRRSPNLWGKYYPELLNDLHTRCPTYIIITSNDSNPFRPITSEQFLNELPEFQSILKEYSFETNIKGFSLWRRNNPPY